MSSSSIDYLAWREHAQVFAQIAAQTPQSFNLTTGGEGPQRISGALVSTNYFETLGIRPLIGRGFTAEQEQPGSERLAVIANRLWRAEFGADPEIVAKRIALDGQFYAVAGVLPPGVLDLAPASVYVPLTFRPEQVYPRMNLEIIGRLAPGVSFNQALSDRIEWCAWTASMDRWCRLPGWQRLTPIREWTLGIAAQRVVGTLFAAVILILMIACANVAGLLVARGASRRREFAIRLALGASRSRLVRQCLTENLPLSLLGGALGLLLAAWLARTRFESLLSAYFRAAKDGLQDCLSSTRRRGLAAALIVVEVAMTVILLFGAGLFVRSLVRLLRVDFGIDPTSVLTFQTDLAEPRYRSAAQVSSYAGRFLSRVASVPGVRSAGVSATLPVGGIKVSNIVSIEGRTIFPQFQFATPGYLAATGMRLIKGRWLSALDDAVAAAVAVVTSSFVREYLPGQDPIGKQIVMGGDTVRRTIVGVVGDVRWNATQAPSAGFYLPLEQLPASAPDQIVRGLRFVVRAIGEPAKLAPAIRGIATQEDRNQPVHDVATMDQILGDATQKERARAVLFAAYGGLALLLAAVGIYAMLHYTVAQRTTEIGVRMAMGATPARVVSLVVGWGLAPVMLGAAAGCICASTLSHLVGAFLFETSPYDPVVYIAVIAATLASSLPAACLPALRAARLDPMRALHWE